MNWGLFLGLESFLLPLSLAVRMSLNGILAGERLRAPVQLMRVITVLFLGALIAGKLPATIYAVTGDFAALGHVTETFMVTPLGLTQMGCLTAGVLVADLAGPAIATRLDADAQTRSALPRTMGIFCACLLLGWLGAR